VGVIHRRQADAFRWDGVALEGYTPGSRHPTADPATVVAATKQILIGAAEGARNFAVRYFELPAGATSSLDHHAHDHGVMIMRGHGVVRLGDERHPIGTGDVVYIAAYEVHQFENPGPEPLGFLCVVGAERAGG